MNRGLSGSRSSPALAMVVLTILAGPPIDPVFALDDPHSPRTLSASAAPAVPEGGASAETGASPWLSLVLPGLSQGLHGEPLTMAWHLGLTAASTAGLWVAQNFTFYRDSTFVPPEQHAAMILQGAVLSWLAVGAWSVGDAQRFQNTVPLTSPSSIPVAWATSPPPETPISIVERTIPMVESPRPSLESPRPTVVIPTDDPEVLILDGYRLFARGLAWEAVKHVAGIRDAVWQPKVRALLADWGPRAVPVGLIEAADALSAGLDADFDLVVRILDRLVLTTPQRRKLRQLQALRRGS